MDSANGLEEEALTDEYCILGHFIRNERDRKGHDTTVWLSLTLLDEALKDDEARLDAALAAWEQESARRRAQRLREVREAREERDETG